MNTDIIARWRDAINDPPPDGWVGLMFEKCTGWHMYGSCIEGTRSGIQWLDVTDVPAVPLVKAQAWVLAIVDAYCEAEESQKGEE